MRWKKNVGPLVFFPFFSFCGLHYLKYLMTGFLFPFHKWRLLCSKYGRYSPMRNQTIMQCFFVKGLQFNFIFILTCSCWKFLIRWFSWFRRFCSFQFIYMCFGGTGEKADVDNSKIYFDSCLKVENFWRFLVKSAICWAKNLISKYGFFCPIQTSVPPSPPPNPRSPLQNRSLMWSEQIREWTFGIYVCNIILRNKLGESFIKWWVFIPEIY